MRFVTKDEAFQLQGQMFANGVSNVSPDNYKAKCADRVRICQNHDGLTESKDLYDAITREARQKNALLIALQEEGLGDSDVLFSFSGKDAERELSMVYVSDVPAEVRDKVRESAEARMVTYITDTPPVRFL